MDYYIFSGDESQGPMQPEELRQHGLNPDSKIWRGGLSTWTKASELPELADLLSEIEKEKEQLREAEEQKQQEETKIAEGLQLSEQQAESATKEEEREYYVAIDGQETGPYVYDQLIRLELTPSTLVWTDGMTEWQEARYLDILKPLFTQQNDSKHTEKESVFLNSSVSQPAVSKSTDNNSTKSKALFFISLILPIICIGKWGKQGLHLVFVPALITIIFSIKAMLASSKANREAGEKSFYSAGRSNAWASAAGLVWLITICLFLIFRMKPNLYEDIIYYLY